MAADDKQLKELERLVERASDRITALSAENQGLRKQLDEAEKSGKSSKEEWQKERAEVEKKLAGLVDRLAKVLDDA